MADVDGVAAVHNDFYDESVELGMLVVSVTPIVFEKWSLFMLILLGVLIVFVKLVTLSP